MDRPPFRRWNHRRQFRHWNRCKHARDGQADADFIPDAEGPLSRFVPFQNWVRAKPVLEGFAEKDGGKRPGMAYLAGVEPATPRSVVWCSVQLSYRYACRTSISIGGRAAPVKFIAAAATCDRDKTPAARSSTEQAAQSQRSAPRRAGSSTLRCTAIRSRPEAARPYRPHTAVPGRRIPRRRRRGHETKPVSRRSKRRYQPGKSRSGHSGRCQPITPPGR